MDRARLAVIVVACGFASTAAAHDTKYPKRDRLELSPAGARVIVDYVIPAGDEARALRELFDRDRSGALDERERAQLAEYLAVQAARFVALSVDGAPVPFARTAIDPALGETAIAPLAVTVTLVAAVLLADGEHRVRFGDRHKDRRVDVPVALAFNRLRVTSRLEPQPFVSAAHALELSVAPVEP
jgi:hypothetical protein